MNILNDRRFSAAMMNECNQAHGPATAQTPGPMIISDDADAGCCQVLFAVLGSRIQHGIWVWARPSALRYLPAECQASRFRTAGFKSTSERRLPLCVEPAPSDGRLTGFQTSLQVFLLLQ